MSALAGFSVPACATHGQALRYDLRWAFWYCWVPGCQEHPIDPSQAKDGA